MLFEQLHLEHADSVLAAVVCPTLRPRLMRLPWMFGRAGFNADRLINRFWDYPRYLARRVSEFDLFHVCDHSYGQLVHVLPAERTGVFCHDLNTFRCLLRPRDEPRPLWFRAMARRILSGLQKAAVVFYSTQAVRDQIEQHQLIDPARLVHAPYGVAPEFTPQAGPGNSHADDHLRHASAGQPPFILHVGSCVPRKRIDVLLQVFSELRSRHPDLRLVQVGGLWSTPQQDQMDQLQLTGVVTQRSGLTRAELADLYRRARLVLQPSESEGFGLPVIEALACGSIVIASAIPALREVGGAAVVYCPVADVAAWSETARRLLEQPELAPSHAVRLAQAAQYSWSRHATTIVGAYERLLGRSPDRNSSLDPAMIRGSV